MWAAKNPYAIYEEPRHPGKVEFWRAMFGERTIGPIFVEGTAETTENLLTFSQLVKQLDKVEVTPGFFHKDGQT